jgi:hypothetical protein
MAKFVEMRANDGLDPAASPRPWLMVRLTSTKQLFLRGFPPGKKVTLKSGIPPIIDAQFIGGVATIRGLRAGTTQVWAEVDGVKDDESVLDVNVKAPLTRKISFTFVSDSAGHHTTRNPANVDGLISALNMIYLPQANIQFVKGKAVPQKVSQDLKDPLTWDKRTILFPLGDSDADFNIFFVWEFENEPPVVEESDGFSMTTGGDFVDARVDGVGGTHCIFEDNLPSDTGVTLAHEVGHMLGVAGDSMNLSDRPFLMFGMASRGTKIPMSDANIMNPSGVATTP